MNIVVDGIIQSAERVLEYSLMVAFGAHMVEFAVGLPYRQGVPQDVEKTIALAGEWKGLALFGTGPRSYVFTKEHRIDQLIKDGLLKGKRL